MKKIEKKELVADSESGQLNKNLELTKALIDLKNKEYDDVEKVN